MCANDSLHGVCFPDSEYVKFASLNPTLSCVRNSIFNLFCNVSHTATKAGLKWKKGRLMEV